MSHASADAPPAAGPADGQGGSLAALARGGLLSLAGSSVSAVAGILVVLAVTRSLPQEVAGTFFALTSVFLIAEVAARLGTGTGLVWAISRARALRGSVRLSALLRVALAPVVGLSVVVGAALFVGAGSLSGLLGGDPDGEAATAVRVLAVLLPLTTLSNALVAATRGSGAILPTVVLDRVGRPLLQLALVVLAVAGGSLTLLTTLWALPWALCAGLAAVWLRRSHRTRPAPAAPEPLPWREFWRFTGPRAVTSVVQLALQRLDIVLLTLLAGPAEAAVYTAATRFLVVGQIAGQALAAVVEPRLGRLLALGDRVAAAAVYRTATGWLVLLCWPLYLLAATYADAFLGWFGEGYDAGTGVVLVLAVAMLLATGVGMVDVVLIMGGRTAWNLGNAVAALLTNVLLDVLLIPRLGLLGAAIGWAAAIWVANLAPLAQVWAAMRLHPFGIGTATAVALSVACFAVLPAVVRTGFDGSWTAPAATAVGAVLYVLGALRWRRALALDTLWDVRRTRRADGRPVVPTAAVG
jgi:O-antigen/teichoic acid export membrane protein